MTNHDSNKCRLSLRNMLNGLIAILVCKLLTIGSVDSQNVQDDTVDLPQGTLRGSSRFIDNRTIYYFLGVPYAEPPLNDRRFRPSSTHTGWTVSISIVSYNSNITLLKKFNRPHHYVFSIHVILYHYHNEVIITWVFSYFNILLVKYQGVYIARQFKPVCPQPTGSSTVRDTMSEDCLYLNIWTPYLPRSGDSLNSRSPVIIFIEGIFI